MPRALWKGAITFGLVHIPVALYPAAREHGIDFDWLDRRSMKPVGYKRVNKATGREVSKDDIVRGLEVEDGQYVVLSDDEIRAANSATTQAVEILESLEVFPSTLPTKRPYVLAPAARGEKVYRLLRDALKKKRRIGVAQVVIQAKQHLAALMPMGDALVLNTLRWADELRSLADIALPHSGSGTKKDMPSERELQMAEQLIDDMSAKWQPEQYEDHFKDDLMALVQRKLKQGKTQRVEPLPAPGGEEATGAEIIDLTELLKRSLGGKGGPASAAASDAPRKKARGSTARKKAPAAASPARKPATRRARA